MKEAIIKTNMAIKYNQLKLTVKKLIKFAMRTPKLSLKINPQSAITETTTNDTRYTTLDSFFFSIVPHPYNLAYNAIRR